MTAVAALTACLAAACTGGSDEGARRPSPTPTPTPSATTPAGQALQGLAGVGERASYRASYVARQHKPASRALWKVWRSPSSLRVDVIEHAVRATLIVTPRAAYSCRSAHHRRTCFRVAGRGKPVPAPFNLAPQALFTTDVRALARQTADYRVRAAGQNDGGPGRPASTCFGITPTRHAPRPRVPAGVYCFAGSGLLVSVRYPSGNSVVVTSVHMRRPVPASFKPYSSPTPLPG